MQKRQLGKGGPLVSAVGLGCMSFSGIYGITDEAESLATLDAALDAGIDFYDTANIYGMGVSETVIGKWLASRRPEIVLATKASIIPGPPRQIDNSEAHLRSELDASLRRLGREQVELFYIHRRDIRIPVEEVVGTLTRLIEAGKIASYGLSEVAPATLRRAHAVHPCRAVQNEYSLWSRQPELGLIQTCAELGVAFIPFSPVARGMLADRPLAPQTFGPGDFRKHNPRFVGEAFATNEARVARFRALAQEVGTATATLAMAWVLARGPHLIPIPGTRSAAHLAELAAAATLPLDADLLARIDRILPVGFAEGDRYADTQLLGVERYC